MYNGVDGPNPLSGQIGYSIPIGNLVKVFID